MTRIFILICVIMFVMIGCSAQSQDMLTAEEIENGDQVRLVDIDFVTVPNFTYYVLLEEKLDKNYLHLIRRYVKYDGITDTESETVQVTALPQKCVNLHEARVRLYASDPEKLALFTHTFI